MGTITGQGIVGRSIFNEGAKPSCPAPVSRMARWISGGQMNGWMVGWIGGWLVGWEADLMDWCLNGWCLEGWTIE